MTDLAKCLHFCIALPASDRARLVNTFTEVLLLAGKPILPPFFTDRYALRKTVLKLAKL